MNNENKIIFYTIGCHDCKRLENKLKEYGIEYETCNMGMEEIKMLMDSGIETAPVLEVNGKKYEYNDAMKLIKTFQNNEI